MTPSDAQAIVIVTDANILINFLHLNRISLLGELPGWAFVVPEEVVNEITTPSHREALIRLFESGRVGRVVVDSMEALALYAELIGVMGKGEAACLALAATSDMLLASDERRRFRRCATERIGEHRLVGTKEIILRAIQQGLTSVAEADEFKALLAANRYVMPFASFSELI